MSDSYTFNGVPFMLVVPNSGETPHFAVKVDATDRKLIGTDRFERSVRSRAYAMEAELWVEPADDLATTTARWEALQDAYAAGTLANLVSPAGTTNAVIILGFDVAPLRGGADGYRGKVVFGLPGGRGTP
jgi:hypothetical protein